MGISIRECSYNDADLAVYIDIEAIVDPEHPAELDGLRHYLASMPETCRPRGFIAESDGRPVGCAQISRNSFAYHPNRFGISVNVIPEMRQRGIGAALYDAAIASVEPLAPEAFRTRVREDQPYALRFAEKRGFREKMREWESVLDMETYDPSRFAHLGARATESGITIKSLAELAAEGVPDWERRIHAAEMLALADVPFVDTFTPVPFDEWRRLAVESPHFLPEAFFAALDGDEIVAVSALWRGGREDTLETGLTGVLRAWRRRGVATALKLAALAYAKQAGIAVVRTENATSNRPMLSINEMLGFEKQPAFILLIKTLSDDMAEIGR